MQRSNPTEHLKPNSLNGHVYFMTLYNVMKAYLDGVLYVDAARFYPDGVDGTDGSLDFVLYKPKLYEFLPGLKVRCESPRRVRSEQRVTSEEEKTAIVGISHLWAKFCFMLFYYKQRHKLESKNRVFVKKEIGDLLGELSETMRGINEHKINLYVFGILLNNLNPTAKSVDKFKQVYSPFINQLAGKCIRYIDGRSSNMSEKITVFTDLDRLFCKFGDRFKPKTIQSLPPLITMLIAQKKIVKGAGDYRSRLNAFQTLIKDWCKVKDCKDFTVDYLKWLISTHSQLNHQYRQLDTRLSRGVRVIRRGLSRDNWFYIAIGFAMVAFLALFNFPNILMHFGMSGMPNLISRYHFNLMEVRSEISRQLLDDGLTPEQRATYEQQLRQIIRNYSRLMNHMEAAKWMLIPVFLMLCFVGYFLFANYLNLPSEPKPNRLPSWIASTRQKKMEAERQRFAAVEDHSDNRGGLELNYSSSGL